MFDPYQRISFYLPSCFLTLLLACTADRAPETPHASAAASSLLEQAHEQAGRGNYLAAADSFRRNTRRHSLPTTWYPGLQVAQSLSDSLSTPGTQLIEIRDLLTKYPAYYASGK